MTKEALLRFTVVVLLLAKSNLDVHVQMGASYYKQYYNQQPEKSCDISRG